MDFRVLGPVQVVAGSRPVELASGRQVAVLCCLLIAGDEACSRDRLIDASGAQPRGAHAAQAAREVQLARREDAAR
jgi:DNA-binding SARP family transcriptional activator